MTPNPFSPAVALNMFGILREQCLSSKQLQLRVTRGQARAFGALIASEMHALTVLRIRRFLRSELSIDDAGVSHWVRHCTTSGFGSGRNTCAEVCPMAVLFRRPARWADLHLIPQLSTARRLECDLSRYPLLLAIEGRCTTLDAFRLSRAEAQPDYPDLPTAK
jgi:hypothetical protein